VPRFEWSDLISIDASHEVIDANDFRCDIKKADKKIARSNVPPCILPPIRRTASMEMPAKIEFLKSVIASLRITLLLQVALSAILFVVGITMVILGFVSPGLLFPATLKTVQTLGGTVFAASGFIPIFFSRLDNFVALRSLLHSYQHQQVGGLRPDAKLDQCFDQYLEKVLRG
jgi:uncharacterized membrane protein